MRRFFTIYVRKRDLIKTLEGVFKLVLGGIISNPCRKTHEVNLCQINKKIYIFDHEFLNPNRISDLYDKTGM